jgi:ribosomal protein L28
MRRAKREAAKASAEKQRAQRLARKEYQTNLRKHRVLVTQEKLAKNNRENKYGNLDSWSPFLRVVAKKTPKLLEKEYIDAVNRLEKMPQRRDIKDWKPKGKGKDTQFISLANHILAKYPTPKFLWSVFWEPDAERLVRYVERIAGGESFAKMCKGGEFPLALTKKQCHAFLQSTSDYTFMSALRRVQIHSRGGDQRLHAAWMTRQVGRHLGNKAEEAFWDSVLVWLARNPMLDLNQLGPLIDYISYRRNQDATFSMKGRSVLAMIRGMNEWHHELQTIREFKEHNYNPSGFKPGAYETKKREKGNFVIRRWTIAEILTSKQLAAEGKALSHCVYSYSHSIARGNVSIWSLSLNQEKMVTIEVSNSARRIVQARGKHNRQITAEEFRVIQKWAEGSGLEVGLYRW